MPLSPEIEALSELIHQCLAARGEAPSVARLRLRLRDLGPNCLDEVLQLRQLQKACQDDAQLSEALIAAGVGDVASMDTRRADPEIGALVQAFNLYVERHLEEG